MNNAIVPPKYVDDLGCRETYADTVQVLPEPTVGVVKVELCVNRYTAMNPVRMDRVVPVARLVLSTALATALRDQLTERLDNAAKHLQHQAQQAPASATKQ